MHAEMLKRMHVKEQQKKREDENALVSLGWYEGIPPGSANDIMILFFGLLHLQRTSNRNSAQNEEEMMRQKRLEGTAVTPESFMEWRVSQ